MVAAGRCGRPTRGKAFGTTQLSVTPASPIITSLTGCKTEEMEVSGKRLFLSFFFLSFYKVKEIKMIPQSTRVMEFRHVKMKTSIL